MDFYKELSDFKWSKNLTNSQLGEYVGMTGEALRMAVKRQSLNKLQIEAFKKLFENQTNEVSVKDTFEYEYLENNHSNSFLKLETGQYIMTMPLADFDVQAGFVDGYQDPEFLNGLKKHTMFVEKPVRGKYVAFKVRGDSMDNGKSDAIVKDSIVSTRELQRHLWRDQIRFKDFEYWVIYTTASRLPLLKQIVGHDVEKGIITCHSLNDGPEYQDFELSLDEVQALFYVVDVHRKIVKRTEY